MKGIIPNNDSYFKLLIILLVLVFLSSCDGLTPAAPVIHSFTADSTSIEEGEIVTLNWSVTEATSVSINQGIGSVALSGSTSVTPTETTTYILTATNSAGSSTASVTIIVEKTFVIQPELIEGKDSYVSSLTPNFNYASSDYLSMGRGIFSTLGFHRDKIVLDSYNLKAFLQFDLDELPASSIVSSAVLKLYPADSLETSGLIIGVHQLIHEWEESTITWNNKPDYLTSPESTITVPPFMTDWLSWDITSLVQGWVNGSIANYGIVLQDDGMTMEFVFINCYSSDYAVNHTLCPKLEITYYVP